VFILGPVEKPRQLENEHAKFQHDKYKSDQMHLCSKNQHRLISRS